MIAVEDSSQTPSVPRMRRRKEAGMLCHVTPALLESGAVLWAGVRGHVCLCSSWAQAVYWAVTLYGPGSERGHHPVCFVYEAEVLGDGMVEDCLGHYAFEYRGVAKKAEEVRPHEDPDGEVVTYNLVVIRSRVPLVVTPALVAAEQQRALCEIVYA